MWPFILIPNLPLELLNILDSPVPFLIGILGNDNFEKEYDINEKKICSNIVHITRDDKKYKVNIKVRII